MLLGKMFPAQSLRCLWSRLFATRPWPHALSPPCYTGLAFKIKELIFFAQNFSKESEISFGQRYYRTRADSDSRSLHFLYRIFLFTPFLLLRCFPGIYFFSTPKMKSIVSELGLCRFAVSFATAIEILKRVSLQ